MNSYNVIGIMSGTSMDGVDIALVSFDQNSDKSWNHSIGAANTYSYPRDLLQPLQKATRFSVEEMCIFDKELGQFFGELVNEFIFKHELSRSEIDAVASHGHTVFHQPEKGFTLQIGCGTSIASISQLPVINDFRTKDVIHGGQGAPLVPIGDTLLFGHLADAFLNIGGFSNICIQKDATEAFDIGPGNLPINEICQHFFRKSFDQNGDIAKSGKVIPLLLEELDNIHFYRKSPPKSLGTEWLYDSFMPILNKYYSEKPEDLIHTVTSHIAGQIGTTLTKKQCKNVLITGGGAKNGFLVERIRSQFPGEIILPSAEMIDFKEAVVFAFLGALYLDNSTSSISSVTGARKESRLGVLHTP